MSAPFGLAQREGFEELKDYASPKAKQPPPTGSGLALGLSMSDHEIQKNPSYKSLPGK